jgi:hypothetical protein
MDHVIPRACPECSAKDLRVNVTASGSIRGPQLLPGLGDWLTYAPITVVVCRDCGLVRFFAQPKALEKLDDRSDWRRLEPEEKVPTTSGV